MDQLPQTLSSRFADPERQVAPVVDIFQLWKSRVTGIAPGMIVEWICDAKSELISVDMRMICGLLTEITIAGGDGAQLRAGPADGE